MTTILPGTRWLVACGLVAAAAARISAQDPTTTLPGAYQVQFDNEYARVVRVHYDAGVKLPEHEHPAGTTVYVYLNDSEGVVFRHSGRSDRAVTRPAVKTGGVRIASGPDEHHTAENPAPTPSDFLRILLKTDAAGGRNMRRIARGSYPAGENATDEQFENTQLRLTRLIVAAGKPMALAPRPEPSLLIALPAGDTRWINASSAVTLSDPGEFLRLDFLTPPRR
jgi:hypothetical protein